MDELLSLAEDDCKRGALRASSGPDSQQLGEYEGGVCGPHNVCFVKLEASSFDFEVFNAHLVNGLSLYC